MSIVRNTEDDFTPERTLMIFDGFVNNLNATTANGGGTKEEHEEHIKRLLNFFPVIAEDDDGKMVELDAASVLTISRTIKEKEVMGRDTLAKGLDLSEDEHAEYAFDLNEFFRVDKGRFVYEKDVEKFLDTLTTNEKFPFSTPELRRELRHTFWLMSRVDSVKAMAKLLKRHPVFEQYEVVIAAGDGRLDESDDTENKKSYDKVLDAIAHHDRTITLSVGQLTTGVTVKPWTAVFILSNMKSPAEYMQAAFRAQNPYEYTEDGKRYQKENAYVFDFAPERTLMIFDDFANNLNATTANGGGTKEEHEEHIKRLLNFFPVIAEDDDGRMVELDAASVLTIPRTIKAKEVIRRG